MKHQLNIQTLGILLYFLCSSMFSFAQERISGKVVDDKGKPIAMANVMLYPDSLAKQPMEAYAVTDSKGLFLLNSANTESAWLRVKCLGYEDHVLKYDLSRSPFQIILQSKMHELDEVVVKGNYSGVKTRGDSVIFDVNHFKTGAEENVSDVLRRLPGMEISETGKVKYEGKNIDKILVNGNDVMSTGSGMMLNGLSADVVSGAEILRNWNDGSLANALKNSDQRTALNIKTSESLRFTAKIDGGGGMFNKYQAKSTSLLIGKNGSFSAALSSNNLGKEILSLEDYIGSIIGLGGLASNGVSQLQLSEEESAMLTPPSNVYRNTNSALILNGVYAPTNKLDIKVGILLNKAKMNAFDRNNSFYFASALHTEYNDSTEKDNETGSANVNIKWQPTSRMEVLSSTFTKLSDYSASQEMAYWGNNSMNLGEGQKLKKNDIRQSLQFTCKLRSTALYALVTFGSKSQDEKLNVLNDSILLPTYYNTGADLYGIRSYLSSNSYMYSLEAGSKWTLPKGYNISLALCHNYNKDDLDTEDFSLDSHKAKGIYKKQSGSLIFEKVAGLLRFKVNASLTDNKYRQPSNTDNSSVKFNYNTLLRLVFSQKSELILTGSRETYQINLNRLADFPIHLSYDRIQNSSAIHSPFINKDAYSLHYRLINNYSNLLLFVSGMYSNTKGGGLANVTQQGITRNLTYTDGGREEWMALHGVVSKGLGHWPVDANIKLSWTQSRVASVLNGMMFNTTVQAPKGEINFITRLKSMFNFDLGGLYKKNIYTSYADRKQYSELFEAHLFTYFKYANFKGTLKYTLSKTNGGGLERLSNNIGFQVSCNLKRIQLTLSGDELLHLHKNDWLMVSSSSYSSTTSYYRRMPGYLLFSCGLHID